MSDALATADPELLERDGVVREPEGEGARIPLKSVFGPYARDAAFGSRRITSVSRAWPAERSAPAEHEEPARAPRQS